MASQPCWRVRTQPLPKALTFLLCPFLSPEPAALTQLFSRTQSSAALTNFLTLPFRSLSSRGQGGHGFCVSSRALPSSCLPRNSLLSVTPPSPRSAGNSLGAAEQPYLRTENMCLALTHCSPESHAMSPSVLSEPAPCRPGVTCKAWSQPSVSQAENLPGRCSHHFVHDRDSHPSTRAWNVSPDISPSTLLSLLR